MPTISRKQLYDILDAAPIRRDRIFLFGERVEVASWSRKAARSWADFMSDYATVDGFDIIDGRYITKGRIHG